MSRLIDRLPEPEKVLENKVIVLSRSRVGTFSLYQALKMLGYKPYHMYEVVHGGITHMHLFEEALRCKFQGAGKPYGKAEFDKWLANFDAIVEIPQFFVEEFVEYYPNAKFMLTERNIDAWARSVNNSIKGVLTACRQFPLTAVRILDPWIDAFVTLHYAFEEIVFHGKGIDGGIEEAKKDTIAIQETAKRLAPKDRFIVCKLEDGFGWEQICPFLGMDIPSTPYPIGNAPAQFKELVSTTLGPRIRNAAIMVAGTVLVPVAAVATWFYL